MTQHNQQNEYNEHSSHLPKVQEYIAELEHQDLWWSTVSMVAKINNENIDPQLLESIIETQKEFQDLRDIMIKELVGRYLNQTNSEITLKAQTTIDILIRNLFERTADVGFLATDDDLVDFMTKDPPTPEDKGFIQQRLEEYVAKYSVYDDVLLVSPSGDIQAKLDPKNPVTYSNCPLIQNALTTQNEYIEAYGYSALFPNKPASLIYAKKMVQESPDGHSHAVGVLCLSFNFTEEMAGIFSTLNAENNFGIMLLNDTGKVLASNTPKQHPIGKQIVNPQRLNTPVISGSNMHFATKTNGYQGYLGLPWYGYIAVKNEVAFNLNKHKTELGVSISKDSPLYLKGLEEVNIKVSTLLLIVIMNGKIMSLKKKVKSFLPILDSFHKISTDIQNIFARFIDHIHQVLLDTIQAKVAFSAVLAVEVMDRNLYERANDCRWWALNSSFRKILSSQHKIKPLSPEESERLTHTLSYINRLYTVYSNIILYDQNGTILAVSTPTEQHLIGSTMPRPTDTDNCLALNDTQEYTVSDFHATELYANEHTYIYHAAIKDWQDINTNVGGIALVFDSKPEFQAMLNETEPKYINPLLSENTFSLLLDRTGHIISSTSPTLTIGSKVNLPNEVLTADNGENDAIFWEWQGKPYLAGYKVSEGYREYKNGDGYINDVIALVCTAI
jgi:hypothetical protein